MQLRGASPAEGRTPLLIGNINSAADRGESLPGEAGIAMTFHGLKVWYGGLELVHNYVPCRNVADAETLTLTDETPDRPKSQAFYIVEAR